MARSVVDIRSLARGHTESAIKCLASIMVHPDSPPSARIAAANSLLERGWGKPAQPISGDPENPLELVTKIERVILRPVPPPPC